MDINYLYTFKEVVKWGSYTRTGEELGYAQSSVTTHIKKLEDYYGQKLFERTGQKMKLTQPGEELLYYVNQVTELLNEAKERLTTNEDARGTVSIGTVESLAAYFITPYIRELKKQYPSLKIMLEAGLCPNLTQGIIDGKYDVAVLLDRLQTSSSLEVIPIRKENMVMIASPSHSFSERNNVIMEEFEGETIILTESGCPYRTLLEEMMRSSGIHMQSVISFSSLEAIKQCVADNLGIALVPEIAVKQEIESGKLNKIPFDHEEFYLYSQLIFKKKKWLTAPIQQFISLVQEGYQKY
ncbi:LysR family transcriptional regulator [Priestia aryabhattai]|uniref:LysR family transcriptional regulator n=1 Tax=Priestia aryabhattai TaxID=412384 RepID=UPI00203E7673|nr:LysR family transcriptional regulator [Priestia aryabhattai]MCM3770839.1 LysR family transcriptional regulator [Priestia aryabhattai]